MTLYQTLEEERITLRFLCLLISYCRRRYRSICKGGNMLEISFGPTCRIVGWKPSDTKVLEYLNLRRRSNMSMYDWVYAKIASISLAFNSEADLDNASILVNDPSEWSILPVPREKRICTSFYDSMIPRYECLFARIWLWLLFSKFGLAILINLKISPFHLHQGHGHMWGSSCCL